MTINNDFQSKTTEYKQKLVITSDLLKAVKSFQTSLQAISRLEKQKIEQMENIKIFVSKFYNTDCVYRDFAEEFKMAISLEVTEIKKLVI